MKQILLIFCSVQILLSLTACSVAEEQPTTMQPPAVPPPTSSQSSSQSIPDDIKTPSANASQSTITNENTVQNIEVSVGDKIFSATLEKNEAANAFIKLLQADPVTLQMNDYSGFEKVGSLGSSLPESNHHITAQSGNIVLYNGNQVCVFYGTNSWSYTRLGSIDDLSGLKEALGSGDVAITFSIK